MGTKELKNVNDTWSIDMWYEGGPHHIVEVELAGECSADDVIREAESECEDWISGCAGAIGGALTLVKYVCDTPRWPNIVEGNIEVEVPPDEKALALMREAGLEVSCDHEWVETGCKFLGGTTMSYKHTCDQCGAVRRTIRHGSQRNPGEHDTVQFFASDD